MNINSIWKNIGICKPYLLYYDILISRYNHACWFKYNLQPLYAFSITSNSIFILIVSYKFQFCLGECFQSSRSASVALTPILCTPYCWTLSRWTRIVGSTLTGTGSQGVRPSPLHPTVCTSTPTPRTLEPTGWKKPFPSARSN